MAEISERIATGYFDDKNDAHLHIENPFDPYPESYDISRVFLHGSCHLFAMALKDKYGYKMKLLSIPNNTCAHVFCCSEINGKQVFIDVRGITSVLKDVIKDFCNNICDIVDYEPEELSDEEQQGLKFAEYVLECNPHFYQIQS